MASPSESSICKHLNESCILSFAAASNNFRLIKLTYIRDLTLLGLCDKKGQPSPTQTALRRIQILV